MEAERRPLEEIFLDVFSRCVEYSALESLAFFPDRTAREPKNGQARLPGARLMLVRHLAHQRAWSRIWRIHRPQL